MWITVYISQKSEEAEEIRTRLENEGIAVKLRHASGDEADEGCYEILVPSREVAEAHNLIFDAEL